MELEAESIPKICKINSLETLKKEEFVLFNSDKRVRLDQVVSLQRLKEDELLVSTLRMLEYDMWATKRILRLDLSKPESKKVEEQMSHILNAMHIWTCRIIGSEVSFKVWQLHSKNDWWDIYVKEFWSLVDQISQKGLNAVITYQTTEGANYQSSILDIIHHIINHSTYHRGQIIMERQNIGGSTISTDFIEYVRK